MNKKLLLLLLCACGVSFAQANDSPVGLWRTIDDESGEEKSLVRISASGDKLVGVVTAIADPERQDATCSECEDERRDQPVLGMEIIRAVDAQEQDGAWLGGNILDPNKGKIYKLKLELQEGGAELKVRGFIGFSLLGRTQIWKRVE